MLQTTLTRSRHQGFRAFDYDLNVYQLEQELPDGTFDHFGPWYIHVYEYVNGSTLEVTDPIELTEDETNSLITSDPYFYGEVDTWYGLDGFMRHKWDAMSDRLKLIFESLPKYKEEVLF